MQRIETRTQLIQFIEDSIVRYAISRACHDRPDRVQVLGGFHGIRPTCAPGWIVSVTSKHGRTWLVAVTTDDHNHVFRAGIITEVPWMHYAGNPWGSEYSIYNGDNPVQSWKAKELACKQ